MPSFTQVLSTPRRPYSQRRGDVLIAGREVLEELERSPGRRPPHGQAAATGDR
jgi:hypothetical protein